MNAIYLNKLNKLARETHRESAISLGQVHFLIILSLEQEYGSPIEAPTNLKWEISITEPEKTPYPPFETRDSFIEWLFNNVKDLYSACEDIVNGVDPYTIAQIERRQAFFSMKYSAIIMDFFRFLKTNNLSDNENDFELRSY